MQRNVWLIAVGLLVILILLNNSIYYFMTKKSLEESLEHELLSLAKQIEISVEQSRLGSEQFEKQIGRELRAAAIATQYALDSDIENVTDQQLKELALQLDINHISLLKRMQDDIVLYRSSDKTQLGKSTKNWVPWHSYFQQLFRTKQVNGNWLGQTLPHFWSGPFEVSSTDVANIYKWGYYYDGTTNYIIDPYVHYEYLREYNEITGIDKLLHDLLATQKNLLEITAINPYTFPDGNITGYADGQKRDHVVQRAILFGSYQHMLSKDEEAVQQAFTQRKIVTLEEKTDNKHLFKMFVPVDVKDKGINITNYNGEPMDHYVLSIVSDYSVITEELHAQFLNIGAIVIILSLFSFSIAWFAMRQFKLSQEKAVRITQETYVEEMNSLFHAIRSQRHDYLNHMQTIHTMAELAKFTELRQYTKQLANEINTVSDVIPVDNPAVAALLRSKLSQADSFKIKFECKCSPLQMKEMSGKTLDINRILGNLIDNAFDEVLNYDENLRFVELSCGQQDNRIVIEVSNYCPHAKQLQASMLFKDGHTTKKGSHQGLGLSIVKEITDRYRGELQVYSKEKEFITFLIMIPN
ncbi:sensor histidine kinase [Paenibacillus yanchengensis]|uniref:Sensor histidine kinase n=1 Tax=Paenibacillus yanchengensis TaxID=2035833 RepID=A0ABW4YQJ1_9BACL